MKILFVFNQLLVKQFSSGGDVKSKSIYDFAAGDADFSVSAIAPHFAAETFQEGNFYETGRTLADSLLDRKFVPAILLLYAARTFEALNLIKEIKVDAVYSTGDFFCNTLPAFIYKKRNQNAKWYACIYHINHNPFRRKSNFILRSIFSYLMQCFSFYLIRKSADVVFVLNKGIVSELKQRGFNNKIVVSALGLDIKALQAKIAIMEELRGGEKKNNLVFFNRVNPTKGVFDLPAILQVVKREYKNIHLDIFGSVDPSIKDKLLEKFAEKSCAGNVNIHGFVESKDIILKKINESKVFLQPSYEEGWSLVLYEGIMSKTVPVAYDLPVYREVFKGRLRTVPLGETDDFAKEVKAVLSLQPEKYNSELEAIYEIASSYDHRDVYAREKEVILNS